MGASLETKGREAGGTRDSHSRRAWARECTSRLARRPTAPPAGIAIDPRHAPECNTINRAELAAIAVAVEIEGVDVIATDSLASIYQIWKALTRPHDLGEHRHATLPTRNRGGDLPPRPRQAPFAPRWRYKATQGFYRERDG